jgi:glycosyltransferase involved in cell wall biosynthesis
LTSSARGILLLFRLQESPGEPVTAIAIVTDNDFEKVSGVTTTLKAVLRHAPDDLRLRVYTASDLGVDEPQYCAMASWGVGLPWYPQMRIFWPHIQQLRRRLRADGIDLLHLTTPGPVCLAARWLWRGSGRPMVGSYHTYLGDYVSTYSGSDALGRALEGYMKWMYAPCETVLVPSEETRARLSDFGYGADRLRVWSRGVDTDCFRPEAKSDALRAAWGADDRCLTMAYVGRLSSEKGLALFAPLSAELTRRDVRHQLVFVGDGPMRAELEAACPRARFLGSVPAGRVAEAVATADVFVFPSATDTLGNVVLEAQACERPVLVTDRGGPQQHMINGVTGWVCPADSVGAFADRLEAWSKHRDAHREMGVAARRYARTRSWSNALVPLYDTWRAAARVTGRPTLAASA